MRKHQLAALGAVLLLPLTLLFSQPGCADDVTGSELECELPVGTYGLPRGGDLVSMTLTEALFFDDIDTRVSRNVEVKKRDGTTTTMALWFVVSVAEDEEIGNTTGRVVVYRSLDDATGEESDLAVLDFQCSASASGSVTVS